MNENQFPLSSPRAKRKSVATGRVASMRGGIISEPSISLIDGGKDTTPAADSSASGLPERSAASSEVGGGGGFNF